MENWGKILQNLLLGRFKKQTSHKCHRRDKRNKSKTKATQNEFQPGIAAGPNY